MKNYLLFQVRHLNGSVLKFFFLVPFCLVVLFAARCQNTKLKSGDTFQDCPTCPEMVVVPPGNFTMGGNPENPEELPTHEVMIKYQLAVGKYPITLKQYRQFTIETGHISPDFCWTMAKSETDIKQIGLRGISWDNPGFRQGEDHPVVCVSWADVQTFLRWLNQKTGKKYRLLSEAEWEYTARAGQTEKILASMSNHSQANVGDKDCCIAGIDGEDKWLYTAPIDAFLPNKYGVYDIAGNVHEWVADCVNGDYEGAPTDGSVWAATESFGKDWGVESSTTPEGQCLDRIARGRAWIFPPAEHWYTWRGWWRIQYPFNFIGFRVAMSIEE